MLTREKTANLATINVNQYEIGLAACVRIELVTIITKLHFAFDAHES